MIFRESFVHYKIALYMPSMGFIAHELIRKQPTWISFTLSLEIGIGMSEHLWVSWEFIRRICLQIAISSECLDEIRVDCFRIRSCAMKPTEGMYRAIL